MFLGQAFVFNKIIDLGFNCIVYIFVAYVFLYIGKINKLKRLLIIIPSKKQ
jgi:hypothetical protein